MIVVDRLLEQRQEEGKPIRVAMVGAGFMGRGIALQIATAVPGMELVAIASRTVDRARAAYALGGADDVRHVDGASELEQAIGEGRAAVTDDPVLVAEAEQVDAVIEVTGTVELAARVTLAAIEAGKHVVLMNAEVDGTLGPVLKTYADRAGVVLTNADGDQPGVQMNLYRFVRGLGVTPVLCGNIKGLHDPYRTPTTQAEFAARWGQNPRMVTSFADGTKISFEQAIVANATGMRVARRGMHGPEVETGTPIKEAAQQFDHDELTAGAGIVDYVVGAAPGPGVFVLGTHDNPVQHHYLNLYKLGEGPLYCFYTPYHLCHFEVPVTVARAALLADAAITPLGAPCLDVLAIAKRDLKAGEVIDALGGYTVYGEAETAAVTARDGLLPIGVAVGCKLRRDIPKDQALAYADVEIPAGRLVEKLRAEQDALFGLQRAAA
jgi:predicted homoserine dehydrogenase-like protein